MSSIATDSVVLAGLADAVLDLPLNGSLDLRVVRERLAAEGVDAARFEASCALLEREGQIWGTRIGRSERWDDAEVADTAIMRAAERRRLDVAQARGRLLAGLVRDSPGARADVAGFLGVPVRMARVLVAELRVCGLVQSHTVFTAAEPGGRIEVSAVSPLTSRLLGPGD